MKYDSAVCNQFVRDMKQMGVEVRHYHEPSSSWQGPGVLCEKRELKTIREGTKVKTRFYQISLDYGFLHPVVSGRKV